MEMNPEFDNLLRLLSSTDEPNICLGLQLAYCYPILNFKTKTYDTIFHIPCLYLPTLGVFF